MNILPKYQSIRYNNNKTKYLSFLNYNTKFVFSVHGGELQTLLDIEGCLTEEQTIICLREILKALQYMHKLNIAHLDVKPQNILLNGEKVEGKSCKCVYCIIC